MIKPESFNLNLIYRCPLCRSEHWLSSKEVNAHSFFICCNKKFKMQPLSSVTIRLKNKDSTISEQAISILKQSGFSLQDIMKSNIQASNDQEFIRKFLAKQNEPKTTTA